jgi:hypothetical protein
MSSARPTSSSTDHADARSSRLHRLVDALLSCWPEDRIGVASPLKAVADLWEAGRIV